MKTNKLAISLLLSLSLYCKGQISQKGWISNENNISIGVSDNYYVYGLIKHDNWYFQPELSIFTTRIQEEYWFLTTNYRVSLHPNFSFFPSLKLGGILHPNLKYVYFGLKACYNYKNKLFISIEPLLELSENFMFKSNSEIQYEVLLDKLNISFTSSPNHFIANQEQYYSCSLILINQNLSVKAGIQLPEDLNHQKMQFVLGFNYSIR